MNLSRTIWYRSVAVLFAALALVSACQQRLAEPLGTRTEPLDVDYSVPHGLSGLVRMDGSSTVFPIARSAGDWFEQQAPGTRVAVGQHGTVAGFRAFIAGECQIANASRPIRLAEAQKLGDEERSILELPIAYDGLSIVVSVENTFVDALTIPQLRMIFEDRSRIRTWQDVDPTWPPERIEMFVPGADSGTFDYFKEVVVGPQGSIRSDLFTSEDDNQLVNEIATRKFALGFFGCAYCFAHQDRVRPVPIVDPATGNAVEPTHETILSGEYAPFSRPLFVYVSLSELKRPEVSHFLNFLLAAAPDAADAIGYVRLPEELMARSREVLANRWTGTHFLSPEGERIRGSLSMLYRPENRVDVLSFAQ
jgi:phosphate transport system substrate-binding protein